MQYGVEVFPYKRISKLKTNREDKKVISKEKYKLLALLVISFLISRVSLVNSMAPFGIAFLMGICEERDEKNSIISACGILLGYISIYTTIAENLGLYFLLMGTIVLSYYILKISKVKNRIIYISSIIFSEIFLYNILVNKNALGIGFLFTVSEIGCILPIYFIIHYSIICSEKIKIAHLFSNEELISIVITLALIVSGTKNVTVFGISLTNILALLLIVFISYVKGAVTGAAVGVAIGTIVGITSNNMMQYIGVYSICGLMSGVFKDTGRWLTAAGFVISFFILKMYSNLGAGFKGAEVFISTAIFMIIPYSIYEKAALEFDTSKRNFYTCEASISSIKDSMASSVESFSGILDDMCYILGNLMENEKLIMKSKSSSLVQNLADRVCSNCNMKSLCWKRENFYTYNALLQLIQNSQENIEKVPEEINRKCIKRTAMIKNAEEITNNFIIGEMKRKSNIENRKLLAMQIGNISTSIKEAVNRYKSDMNIDIEKEEIIKRVLDKNLVNYKELLCTRDTNDKVKINFKMEACNGKQKCVKEILPIVNKALGRKLCVRDDGCNIDRINGQCEVVLEDMPKYHIATYVSECCKDGEKHNGDSYCYEKLDNGTYIMMLADGMGTGPEAEKESRASINLVEKIIKAGFSNMSAINTVNSVMTLKFSTDEKYSTLDLCSIDLYNGNIEFMKVGAVQSFVKRGEEVKIINSKTLPIGVLDNADVEVCSGDIQNGDVIVMVTDGILDFEGKSQNNIQWLVNILKENQCNKPDELANIIVNEGKRLSNGTVKDDITVMVSKVYELY